MSAAASLPPIKWAQRKDSLYVTIDLADVKDHAISLDAQHLRFRSVGGRGAPASRLVSSLGWRGWLWGVVAAPVRAATHGALRPAPGRVHVLVHRARAHGVAGGHPDPRIVLTARSAVCCASPPRVSQRAERLHAVRVHAGAVRRGRRCRPGAYEWGCGHPPPRAHVARCCADSRAPLRRPRCTPSARATCTST